MRSSQTDASDFFITCLLRSNLQMILQLVHRLVNEFSFNSILSFKRQPHVMNELGWFIFGHKLLCKEIEDTEVGLPVCLEAVRVRVIKEVIRMVIIQQILELTNVKHFFKYWCHRLRRWKLPSCMVTLQVIQLPEYSPGDLSGILLLFVSFTNTPSVCYSSILYRETKAYSPALPPSFSSR